MHPVARAAVLAVAASSVAVFPKTGATLWLFVKILARILMSTT